MNKESIYQIIGYQGKYNESVKRALKKLLKENHPDHGGDRHIFELITKVKQELETNNVSYKVKAINNKQYDDIDYDYCNAMIIKLLKEEEKIKSELQEKNKALDELNNDYKEAYYNSIEKESMLINNFQKLSQMTNLKSKLLLLIVFLIVILIVAIFENKKLFLCLFGIGFVFIIREIYVFYRTINSMNKKNQDKIKNYNTIVHQINEINSSKKQLEKELLNQERKLKNVQNDLRFYRNLISK